ncbi:MAG: hypothetical protein JXA42_24750 [Anaerolineales bacterium]|nr:hypothetical protein [Anaerolineales bacterium]
MVSALGMVVLIVLTSLLWVIGIAGYYENQAEAAPTMIMIAREGMIRLLLRRK